MIAGILKEVKKPCTYAASGAFVGFIVGWIFTFQAALLAQMIGFRNMPLASAIFGLLDFEFFFAGCVGAVVSILCLVVCLDIKNGMVSSSRKIEECVVAIPSMAGVLLGATYGLVLCFLLRFAFDVFGASAEAKEILGFGMVGVFAYTAIDGFFTVRKMLKKHRR